MDHQSIESLAQRWLQEDHDETTRSDISDLLQNNNVEELELRLRKRIAFGTAGLRAAMKAGFSFMNSLTVLQASHGLAQYIINYQAAHSPDLTTTRLSVAIGHDARYNSEKFARLAALAFLSGGFRVLWFGRIVHTPMIPFTVKYFGADAGVMVTASHNPKSDNGYKVYWSNGSQIIPPHDAGIAAAIEKVSEIETWDASQIESHEKLKNVYAEAKDAYLESIKLLTSSDETGGHDVASFMYTPMHGVGLPFMKQAVETLGYSQSMQTVEAQAHPDPDFPTVPFPNPEEKGALDLAKREAEKINCNLVLSNDPDADRFSAAELVNSQWHQFTGNQIGVLLAVYILETHSTQPRSKLAMLASTVSSRMLSAIASHEGFLFRETLTGFKWLGNVGQDLLAAGYDPCFAYEEAIGYMFSSVVWDKDGIAAAAVWLRACAKWQRDEALTPWHKLQNLYKKYGYFEDANTYLISPSPETTNRVFADIRKLNNGQRPEKIGNRTIKRWRDLTLGYDSGTSDGKPELPVDASAQMITCELEGDVVFTARGSGTEPKIKLYIEGQGTSSAEARASAEEILRDLLAEWFRPEYGLRLAGT